MATNWTCMGVEPALKYGTLAGELSVRAMVTGDYTILKEFQNMWEKTNKAAYDNVADMASTFWSPDYYQWEWIIKNDLAFLSPEQILGRMEENAYVLKKHQLIFRALTGKIRSFFDKNRSKPQLIHVNALKGKTID
jgi:hypothetical protein